MKTSKRNAKNMHARNKERANGPPKVSRYAAKRGIGVPLENVSGEDMRAALGAHFNKEPS